MEVVLRLFLSRYLPILRTYGRGRFLLYGGLIIPCLALFLSISAQDTPIAQRLFMPVFLTGHAAIGLSSHFKMLVGAPTSVLLPDARRRHTVVAVAFVLACIAIVAGATVAFRGFDARQASNLVVLATYFCCLLWMTFRFPTVGLGIFILSSMSFAVLILARGQIEFEIPTSAGFLAGATLLALGSLTLLARRVANFNEEMPEYAVRFTNDPYWRQRHMERWSRSEAKFRLRKEPDYAVIYPATLRGRTARWAAALPMSATGAFLFGALFCSALALTKRVSKPDELWAILADKVWLVMCFWSLACTFMVIAQAVPRLPYYHLEMIRPQTRRQLVQAVGLALWGFAASVWLGGMVSITLVTRLLLGHWPLDATNLRGYVMAAALHVAAVGLGLSWVRYGQAGMYLVVATLAFLGFGFSMLMVNRPFGGTVIEMLGSQTPVIALLCVAVGVSLAWRARNYWLHADIN